MARASEACEVAPQPGELWHYLPWLAAPAMDLLVFVTLLWSHSRLAWITGESDSVFLFCAHVAATVGISCTLFLYFFRARVLPRDGARFDSPFAFVHIVSLCILSLVSYFVFFALNLDSELFLALHLLFWLLALVGALCLHHCAAKDPGSVSPLKSGLLSESCPVVLPE